MTKCIDRIKHTDKDGDEITFELYEGEEIYIKSPSLTKITISELQNVITDFKHSNMLSLKKSQMDWTSK
jgi:hypothetical protein